MVAAMISLWQFARRQGDIEQAVIWAKKNLAHTRGPFQLFDAGQIALVQGNLAQAEALFQEGLSLGQKDQVASDIAYFLHGFTLLALEKKQLWKAARLFGATSNFLKGEQDVLAQAEYERLVERLRAQLGEKAFAS